MKKIEPRQLRFIQEYLICLNGYEAARRAGYAHPREASPRLMAAPHVAAEIKRRMDERSRKLEITAEKVLAELAKIGFANMQDYMKSTPQGDPYLDFSDVTRDQAAALAEVTVDDYVDGRGEDAREVKRVRFKLADKRAALVDIGKHLGMFKEKMEVSGPNGGPIQNVQMTAEEAMEYARQRGLPTQIFEE